MFSCSSVQGTVGGLPPVWKRHNEIKNRSALHLSAMSIQKRSIPTTGALGCSPATPAPQRLYVESDSPTVTAPVQQSQGCHSSRWHAIRPGHRSHGAHSLHTPRIHLAHEIEVTRDPKSFFPCDVGLSPNILGSYIPKSGVSPDLAHLTRQVVDFPNLPHRSYPSPLDPSPGAHGSGHSQEAAVVRGRCGPAPSNPLPAPPANHRCCTAPHVGHRDTTALPRQWYLRGWMCPKIGYNMAITYTPIYGIIF